MVTVTDELNKRIQHFDRLIAKAVEDDPDDITKIGNLLAGQHALNDFRAALQAIRGTDEGLRSALEPFAAACDQYVADWRSDDFPVPVYIKASDLRKARDELRTRNG